MEFLIQEWNLYHTGKKRLKVLTPREKEILSSYIDNNTRTNHQSMMDGTVAELVAVGVIRRATSLTQRPPLLCLQYSAMGMGLPQKTP